MFALLVAVNLPGQAPPGAEYVENPLFRGQDPYVTYEGGKYYYSESDGDSIYVRESAALSRLGAEPRRVVWTSPERGWDGHANVWAPEIHAIGDRWYLYFAADYHTDGRHRLYVLEAFSPFGPYSPADTGAADGQLAESTGRWAIDPDVFTAADNRLYLVWSCTDDDIGKMPQNLCIARMRDPVHIESATTRLASPTEPWETRTGAIEEGPAGFVRNGIAYVTYSASASWTANDYTAGVMVSSGGDPLDPKSWRKYGPILDHHGRAYVRCSHLLRTAPSYGCSITDTIGLTVRCGPAAAFGYRR